jgi:hypothetical protein
MASGSPIGAILKEKTIKRRIGIGKLLLIAGLAAIFLAAGLLGGWMFDRKRTSDKLSEILINLTEAIPEEAGAAADRMNPEDEKGPLPVMQIEGINCAGILEIESLNRSWPVGGTDEKTEDLPCLRTYGEDSDKQTESFLIIQGRDLPEQFSMLTQMTADDTVRFTDVNGNRYIYTVAFAGSGEDLEAFKNFNRQKDRKYVFDLELVVDTVSEHPLIIGCRLKQ